MRKMRSKPTLPGIPARSEWRGVCRANSMGPLFWPDVSRLVIDCNRAPDAKSLIVTESEGRPVPANRAPHRGGRSRRLERIHAPYHAAIDACLRRRLAGRQPTALVAIHSYTPVYFGKARPWQVKSCSATIAAWPIFFSGDCRPTRGSPLASTRHIHPGDQVHYTVERHAHPSGLPAAMIEIRNDEIGDQAGQQRWSDRLAQIVIAATPDLLAENRTVV